MERFDAAVMAFCLMSNHFHLVLQTRHANLSRLMRHINAGYCQAFNRRHGIVGHVLEGRFKSIIVDSDSYLMELCRYVELNPVRAGMVRAAGDWEWSSYRAHVGLESSPVWLDTSGMHGHVLGHDAKNLAERQCAQAKYAALVTSGRDDELWGRALRQGLYLGGEAFIERVRGQAEPARLAHKEILRTHRGKAVTLSQWLMEAPTREEALRLAHVESGLSMSAIAAEMHLSVSRVSRLIARAERHASENLGGDPVLSGSS